MVAAWAIFWGTIANDPRTQRSRCEAEEGKKAPSSTAPPINHRFLRKRATLQEAVNLPRRSTQQQVAALQRHRTETLRRWERDEEGWRELPARAWPAYQPTEAQMADIQTVALQKQCFGKSIDEECQELLFRIATTLVFYNVDPPSGLAQFRELAVAEHNVDAMVACGVVLVEGLGVKPNEKEGIEWLEKAVAMGSSQACYELGVLYYTGIDGILEEDPTKAFQLFERAAAKDHTAALYMVADCLVEGEGTDIDVARAVPLFYQAAERGHRFARQRIREMLDEHRGEIETEKNRG